MHCFLLFDFFKLRNCIIMASLSKRIKSVAIVKVKESTCRIGFTYI